MIQRIQSVWLLLAAFSIFCLLFFPIIGASTAVGEYMVYGSGLKMMDAITQTTNVPLLAGIILAGLISLLNVFNFSNRKLQIRIAWLNILLVLALCVWIAMLIKNIPNITELNIEFASLLPLLAIIFTYLAIRGIKSDEKLIRSADRLR
jgi:peptidoglycan/LPS O-acetylase OafA/YrhL